MNIQERVAERLTLLLAAREAAAGIQLLGRDVEIEWYREVIEEFERLEDEILIVNNAIIDICGGRE